LGPRIPKPLPILHSLHYLHVAVSEPSPGIPQYMITGFVDGIPFTRYDSERGRMEPLSGLCGSPSHSGAPWGWNGALWGWDTIPWVSVGTISPGLHTRLRVYGCELLSDGSVHGSYQNGYDGRDFISFDLESGRFIPADSAAEITRRRWEQEGTEAEKWTNYLKHECPEWLQRHIRYGQKELEPGLVWEGWSGIRARFQIRFRWDGMEQDQVGVPEKDWGRMDGAKWVGWMEQDCSRNGVGPAGVLEQLLLSMGSSQVHPVEWGQGQGDTMTLSHPGRSRRLSNPWSWIWPLPSSLES
uniref:MHC class I-like antigen recognition-like domain-containing protein n=1 Tax=Zonotrichia albicollis TaxID=44394 RepID=A0A8D2M1N9_ZONAL